MSRVQPFRQAAAGFSLTELAIVLVIVGLLLGMLMPPLSSQAEQRHYNETRRALAEAQEALLGFAAANGRLPRPAVSFADGSERPTTCANDAACTGFIPWQTLGIRKTDSWNKLLRYSVTPAYANASFTLTTTATKKLQSRDAAGALLYQVGNASACSPANPCAAAVIYSAGRSHWGTLENGTAVGDGSTTNADEDSNETATTVFVVRPFAENSSAGGGEFDDLVAWLPTTVLFNRLIVAGRLP